jgi:hypothetical protein
MSDYLHLSAGTAAVPFPLDRPISHISLDHVDFHDDMADETYPTLG